MENDMKLARILSVLLICFLLASCEKQSITIVNDSSNPSVAIAESSSSETGKTARSQSNDNSTDQTSEATETTIANPLRSVFSDNSDDGVSETEQVTENTNITHPEIDKVIIEYTDTTAEITESEMSFEFLDEIKSCEAVPKTSLTRKVATLIVQYTNGEKEEFAELYLGDDGFVYAKYIKSKSTEYAYKFSD